MPEIHTKSKTDRIWIAKLKSELGQNIFAHVIHRMLKRDSLRTLAVYCNEVNPNYSFGTYRKWLTILERTVVSKRREEQSAQEAINEYNAEQRQRSEPSLPIPMPPTPDEISLRELARVSTREWKAIATENMLKYAWLNTQQALEGEIAFAKASRMPYPIHRTIRELTRIAIAYMQLEFRWTILKIGGPDIDMADLDPETREFAQLSDVDRNIIHNLQRKFVNLIAEDPNGRNALEELGIRPDGTFGTEEKSDTPDVVEPDA